MQDKRDYVSFFDPLIMASEARHDQCCNARLRDAPDGLEKTEPGEWVGEGYCKRPASGGGRCRNHGGNGGRPPTHGLYSARREELREKLTEAQDLETPGSLWREIHVLRALKAEYLERMDEPTDADDIDAVTTIDKEIRRLTNTINTMMHRDAPTEEEVGTLITGFANILQNYVPESDRADAIEELETIVGDDRRLALESGR